MKRDEIKSLLLIPVYNHSSSLRSVVERALETGWEVLVVDDGSDDDIGLLLEGLECGVHVFSKNKGKGAAILAGARIADELGFDAVLTLDADGQHDPVQAKKLMEPINESWPVIVLGNRQMGENVPLSSRFGRGFSNFWVSLETGVKLPDTQTGMRLYPIHEILQLPLKKRRYDFEIEVLVRSIWAGIQVQSVDIEVHYPEPGKRQSHFDPWLDNIRLTLLHTQLVCRTLLPVPHKKLLKKTSDSKPGLLFHPFIFFKMVIQEHLSPVLVAAAIWLGIFLGTLPLIACHTVIIIYVTHKLHLNKVVAVSASQICMPPFVPVLCIELGYFMRHGSFLTEISRQTLVTEIGQRFWEYLLGSLVVGPLLGFLVSGIAYAIHISLLKFRSARS